MAYVPLGDPFAGPAQFWMAGSVEGYWFEYTTMAQPGGNVANTAATAPTARKLVLGLGPIEVSASLASVPGLQGHRGRLIKITFVDEGAPYENGALPDGDRLRVDDVYEYSLPTAMLDEYSFTLGAGRTSFWQVDIEDPTRGAGLPPWFPAARFVPVLGVYLHAP
ncbi:MAG: hypothetical protein ACXVJW_03235 [Acidimicrobiia bacterium]